MAKAKGKITGINVYDDSKKCAVCNGPRRVPSWWEMQMVEGEVEKRVARVEAIRRTLWPMIDNPQFGTHEVQRVIEELEEACVQRGEAEQVVKVVTMADAA